MNQEVKFRAWDKTSEKWAYLDLSKANLNLSFEIDDKGDNSTDLQSWLQYTGLKDKNGTKIYGGDYVLVRGLIRCQIHYSVNHARWFAGSDYLSAAYARDCEVIGNIYQNPELLSVNQ